MTIDILNFKPIIINNVFTEDEIDEIYRLINNKIIENINNGLFEYDGFEVSKGHGSFSYHQVNGQTLLFSESIHTKIREKMENALGLDLREPALSFQRYSLMSGNTPQLRAHTDSYSRQTDQTNDSPLVSHHIFNMSVPLRNKFTWDLGIRTKNYQINNNDGILYSTTANPHRRVYREFKVYERYDVLIVRILPKNNLIPIVESENADLDSIIHKMEKMNTLEKNNWETIV